MDPATGLPSYQRVAKTFVRETDVIVKVETTDGRSVEATPNHPFWVEGKGFVEARKLARSDLLREPSGRLAAIQQITARYGSFLVYNFEVANTHSYFAGGWWVHNQCYRDTFFNAHPELNPNDWYVHHAIEQQVLDRYPGLFTAAEIHDLENLRGISKVNNDWMHLSAIRQEWNEFYSRIPFATRTDIEAYRNVMDNRWGGNWIFGR